MSSRIGYVYFEAAQELRTGDVFVLLWNEFTVSIMRSSVFYFSPYKTELKLKLLENLVQIFAFNEVECKPNFVA